MNIFILLLLSLFVLFIIYLLWEEVTPKVPFDNLPDLLSVKIFFIRYAFEIKILSKSVFLDTYYLICIKVIMPFIGYKEWSIYKTIDLQQTPGEFKPLQNEKSKPLQNEKSGRVLRVSKEATKH